VPGTLTGNVIMVVLMILYIEMGQIQQNLFPKSTPFTAHFLTMIWITWGIENRVPFSWFHGLILRDIQMDFQCLRIDLLKFFLGNLTGYCQWEDAGPFGTSDAAYVFGLSSPQNTQSNNAGLAVSPALAGYLGFLQGGNGSAYCNWQFIEANQVPPFFGGSAGVIVASSAYINVGSAPSTVVNGAINLSTGAIIGISVAAFVIIVASLITFGFILFRVDKYRFAA